MNVHEMSRKMLDAKTECDQALQAYVEAVAADADAFHEMKKTMAMTYVKTREELPPKATVPYVAALVDEKTVDVQKNARLKEGLKRAASMRCDVARQWLSSLQSLAAAERAEAELTKWEPREVAS